MDMLEYIGMLRVLLRADRFRDYADGFPSYRVHQAEPNFWVYGICEQDNDQIRDGIDYEQGASESCVAK